MKCLVSFLLYVALAPLLLSDVSLHAQEAHGEATVKDGQCGVPMLAQPCAKGVDLVEAPELSNRHKVTECQSDALSCGPLDFAGKARYFAGHSFGLSAFIGPLLWSAPILAKPPAHYPQDWRQGAGALGRLYGDALSFQTTAQTAKFLTGAALHEDPRYSVSSSRNPFARAMHAMAFTAFEKSDSDDTTLAVSNLVASVSAGLVGNAYLPPGYNDRSHAVSRMGIEFGSFAITNLAQEFTPEFRWLGKRLHLPSFMLPTSSADLRKPSHIKPQDDGPF